MLRSDLAPLLGVALLPLTPPAVHAQRLLETEGVELRGTARVVAFAASTCSVNETQETPASYEQRKDNHGQPIDIWQLDFSVYNGSGKALDHLIALYGIETEWLPCTTWDLVDSGNYPGGVEWGSVAGQIQRSGSANPTTPGETLTSTKYVYVFHQHQPRFERWSVDYNFAAAASPPTADADSGQATAAPARRLASVVSLKWRSHGLLSPGCPPRRPSTCTAPGPGSGRRCRP